MNYYETGISVDFYFEVCGKIRYYEKLLKEVKNPIYKKQVIVDLTSWKAILDLLNRYRT